MPAVEDHDAVSDDLLLYLYCKVFLFCLLLLLGITADRTSPQAARQQLISQILNGIY